MRRCESAQALKWHKKFNLEILGTTLEGDYIEIILFCALHAQPQPRESCSILSFIGLLLGKKRFLSKDMSFVESVAMAFSAVFYANRVELH